MGQIEWNDSYSVNNAEIDEQHKKWIKIYNDLHNKMVTGEVGPKDGLVALQAMLDYARYHFSFEEKFMRAMGYPDFIGHHRLHKDFDNLLYGYCRKAENGELVLNSEIIDILKQWLVNHIVTEDQKYVLFSESKG
jgi:hemerythrin